MGQYQLYILLTILSFIVNVVLGTVSLTIDHRHRLNRSFAALSYALAWWALMKMAITFSSTEEWATIFYKLSGLGWTFLPAYYVHVVHAVIRKHSGARRYVAWALLGISAVLYLLHWTGDLMLEGMQMVDWGYTDVPGRGFNIGFQPFLIGSFVYLVVELAVFSAKAARRTDRIKGLLVMIGLLIPLIGGGLTNMLLPSLGIYVFELAVPLTTVNAGIIAYAMYGYRLMAFRVDYVSNAIITAIDDPMLVVNPDGRVGLVNSAALELLGRERSSLVGTHINDLLSGRKFDDDFRKNVSGKGSHAVKVEVSCEDGERVEVDLKASELRNDRGRLVGYVLVIRDSRRGRT